MRLGAILEPKTKKNSKVFGLEIHSFGVFFESTRSREVELYIVLVWKKSTSTNSARNHQFAGFQSFSMQKFTGLLKIYLHGSVYKCRILTIFDIVSLLQVENQPGLFFGNFKHCSTKNSAFQSSSTLCIWLWVQKSSSCTHKEAKIWLWHVVDCGWMYWTVLLSIVEG